MPKLRNLVIVFGDQLDENSAAFDGFDDARDAVLQCELREEATYIPQHKLRIAYFFSAMRHFAQSQRARGRRVVYVALDDPGNTGAMEREIRRQAASLKPARLIALEPGDFRLRAMLHSIHPPVEIREDRHFLCTHPSFAQFLDRHPRPMMETFYRMMRREHRILIDAAGEPVGGAWNFDQDNRESYKRNAPSIPPPLSFPADDISRDVVTLVRREFADAPGKLGDFTLPVTRAHAQALLDDFVTHRLPHFGRYQDAMRHGEVFGFHSRLSGPLNLHMIDPRQVVERALANPADAPLNAVEGYVRQIIGWREFVRGMYWRHMPGYAQMNALGADLPMPQFYWTGQTQMRCLADAIAHTIDHAYAHHIERLMVLGLYALLLGVNPYEVHRWHMSMFWDAIDWVSLPNTLGMGQHGDGGIVGTKPYAASGAYIDRMSDHCRACRYDPRKVVGEDACPFTTLYWDFLARHRQRLARNGRMRNMIANLDRKDAGEMRAIRDRAAVLKVAG